MPLPRRPRKDGAEQSAKQSRVYRYGCKLRTDGALVYDQMFHAHRYRNQLVALERWRREQVEAIVREVSPRVAELEETVFDAEMRRDEKRDELRKLRQQAQRRVVAPELSAEIRDLSQVRKEAYAELKIAKAATYENPIFQARQLALEEDYRLRTKAARKETPAYWGTYLTVEKSMGNARSGPPPRFKSWRGDGRIAIQVQGRKPTFREVLLGQCNQISVTRAADGKHYDVKMRLAAEKKGKDPSPAVWASCRAKLHRMPPEDAQITWVTFVCRRIGTHDHWSVQFTLARDAWEANRGEGVVAVNLGWRLRPCGSIRAAYWLDEFGETGELLLPPNVVGRLAESKNLRSIRDKNFDSIKLSLLAWLKTATNLPEWMTEEFKTLSHWRSQKRLAKVVFKWRDERFAGDADIFDLVEAWRKQDRHLYDWEANTRRKYIAWRRNLYRHFAKDMSTRYATVVLADVKWKQIQDKPKDEEPDEMKAARARKAITSPHELQQTLTQAISETVKIPARNMTATHAACGELSRTENPLSILHTCESCGEQYDQDDNHCRNLLAARIAALVGA